MCESTGVRRLADPEKQCRKENPSALAHTLISPPWTAFTSPGKALQYVWAGYEVVNFSGDIPIPICSLRFPNRFHSFPQAARSLGGKLHHLQPQALELASDNQYLSFHSPGASRWFRDTHLTEFQSKWISVPLLERLGWTGFLLFLGCCGEWEMGAAFLRPAEVGQLRETPRSPPEGPPHLSTSSGACQNHSHYLTFLIYFLFLLSKLS